MSRFRFLALVVFLALLPSCATLQSLAALGQVDWELDRVSGIRLAGVQVDQVRSYEDLSLLDATRIGAALSGGRLPLDLNLHMVADNPDDNPDARLLELEWTLFLRDRETVSGQLDREISLPAGERTDIAMLVELDLLEFFDGPQRDLVDVALSLAGAGGEPVDLRIEILPTIQTPVGPLRHPGPIVLGGTADHDG